MNVQKITVDKLKNASLRSDEETKRAEIDFRMLVDNIAVEGIQTPLVVCPDPEEDGKYLIASGNRRFQAGLELGFKEFYCRIFPYELFEEIRISSNIHREELAPSLRAKYVKIILNKTNKSLKQISDILGIPYDKIRKETYVDRLIPALKKSIDERIISVRAGAFIAPLTPKGQEKLYEIIRPTVEEKRKTGKHISRNLISSIIEDFSNIYFRTEEKKHQKEGVEAGARRKAKKTLEKTLSEIEKDLIYAQETKNTYRDRLTNLLNFLRKCLRKPEIRTYIRQFHPQKHARIVEIAKLENIDLS